MRFILLRRLVCRIHGHKRPDVVRLSELFNMRCKRCGAKVGPEDGQSLVPYTMWKALVGDEE